MMLSAMQGMEHEPPSLCPLHWAAVACCVGCRVCSCVADLHADGEEHASRVMDAWELLWCMCIGVRVWSETHR